MPDGFVYSRAKGQIRIEVICFETLPSREIAFVPTRLFLPYLRWGIFLLHNRSSFVRIFRSWHCLRAKKQPGISAMVTRGRLSPNHSLIAAGSFHSANRSWLSESRRRRDGNDETATTASSPEPFHPANWSWLSEPRRRF